MLVGDEIHIHLHTFIKYDSIYYFLRLYLWSYITPKGAVEFIIQRLLNAIWNVRKLYYPFEQVALYWNPDTIFLYI